ncbi:MAG: Card1-like endonuclease domain-containing protein [Campylobacterota bacterium]
MVLVSLMGDFNYSSAPILYRYKDTITKHIILSHCDSRSSAKVKKLIKGEKQLKKIETLQYKIISLKFDKTDAKSIKRCYKQLVAHAKTSFSNIYFNTTDGLSTVAIMLSQKLMKKGAKVVSYDSYENAIYILTKSDLNVVSVEESISIKKHLQLRGYRVLSYYHKYDLLKRKRLVLKLAKDLRYYKEFAKHFPIYDKQKFARFNSILQNLELDEKSATNFVRGVVFEEYIYHLIYDNLDVDDIMCGVTVEFDDGHVNEFDILIMKDNHLHTIECKFANNINADNTVYKLDSTKHYLDEESKGMLLVVSEDDIRFSNGVTSRAKSGDIRIHYSKDFNKKHFLVDIKEWFGLEYRGMIDTDQTP